MARGARLYRVMFHALRRGTMSSDSFGRAIISPHRCNLLRRHWCRLGWDTVFWSVLSMTQTGTRRFCFPAFKRRIFFAAGLFFDISSTFSDSPNGRIAAALGQLGEDLLQCSITHGAHKPTLFGHGGQIGFDGSGTLRLHERNACEACARASGVRWRRGTASTLAAWASVLLCLLFSLQLLRGLSLVDLGFPSSDAHEELPTRPHGWQSWRSHSHFQSSILGEARYCASASPRTECATLSTSFCPAAVMRRPAYNWTGPSTP